MFLLGGLTNIADFLNAGTAMRDRGKYLQSGTWRWFGPGTTAFTGVLIGHATWVSSSPGTGAEFIGSEYDGAWYSIDGGPSRMTWGMTAVPIMRWCQSSVALSAGVAWGVDYPAGSNVPSYSAILRAMDRVHKDGSMARVEYVWDYGGPFPGSALFPAGDLANLTGNGVALYAQCWMRPGAGFSDGASMNAALDFYVDGTYRFSISPGGQGMKSQSNGLRRVGTTAAFGGLKYTTAFRVGMRRGSDSSQHVDHQVTGILGA